MRLILAILMTLTLTGCFTTVKYVDKPVYYTREPLGMTTPEPISLEPVNAVLVKPEDSDPYVTMTPEDYRNLILNNKVIEGYIRDANGRIQACEAYYTEPVTQE